MRKTEEYVPLIQHGVPVPERERETTRYTRKMPDGALAQLAQRMKPGDSVVLPAGSKGKLKSLMEERGLKTTSRLLAPVDEARVWVLPFGEA